MIYLFLVGVVALSLSCAEQYPVTSCKEGQGYALDESGIPIRGEASAPISATIFGDFECPPTAKMSRLVLEYVDELQAEGQGGKVKMLYRHFPSNSHARARAAAEAAVAAFEQGNDAFWAIFPHLFHHDDDLEDEDILLYAEQAGLDIKAFQASLGSEEVAAAVDRDISIAIDIGLIATPGVLICGQHTDASAEEVIDNLKYLVGKL